MDIIAEIRRRHLVSGESISAIARSLKLSRPTVRKHLHTTAEPVYARQQQPSPKLGEFQVMLQSWLTTEQHLPRAQRRTAQRLFEGLQVEGYRGAYDSVQRFVKQWKSVKNGPTTTQAFVPLVFAPGDACQFDWSHEHVEIDGVPQTIKVAHFRLAYSRQMFVAAYPRETQEMVFDAHNRAFAFFGGVPHQRIPPKDLFKRERLPRPPVRSRSGLAGFVRRTAWLARVTRWGRGKITRVWARRMLHSQQSCGVLDGPRLVATMLQQTEHLERIVLMPVRQRISAMVRIDLVVATCTQQHAVAAQQ